MMKIILLVLVMLASCAPALAQKNDDWKIEIDYDKFKDVTTTLLAPMPISDDKARLPVFLFAAFQCPGQATCRLEGVILGFAIVTLTEEYSGQGMARSIRDGIRQPPHKLTYLGPSPASLSIPFLSHPFKAMLRPEGLIKIANSKQVEFQIDTLEFTLTAQNLAALRGLASRMQP